MPIPKQPNKSWTEWDIKSQYRGIDHKYMEPIEGLIDQYPNKIARLQEMLVDLELQYEVFLNSGKLKKKDLDDVDLYLAIQEKIERLTDKYWTCKKEKEGRDLGHFNRTELHETIYFIDLDNGNDANTGLNATGQEWLTLAKYTTTTVRTAGDIAKVRAATSEVMGGNLVFDEDGNQDDYIEIRGCSIADDPWSDGSDVKPSLSFGDTANELSALDDDYWKINRLIVKESTNPGGGASIGLSCNNWYFLACEFTDCGAIGAELDWASVLFEDCIFQDNTTSSLFVYASYAQLVGCTFNGGPLGTDNGIITHRDAYIELVDCSFGQTTSHNIVDINLNSIGDIKHRNCAWDIPPTIAEIDGYIFGEDDDAVYGAGLLTQHQGTVTKDTGVKTGLATFSNKILPNTNCGVNNFLTLNRKSIIDWPFIINCIGGVSKTVTVQIRSKGTWGTYPVNTELFLEFWYLDHAVDATRTKIVSTQVLSHASDWVEFTVTFTPLQTGVAYGTVKLGIYEDAGDGCYVNGEAT